MTLPKEDAPIRVASATLGEPLTPAGAGAAPDDGAAQWWHATPHAADSGGVVAVRTYNAPEPVGERSNPDAVVNGDRFLVIHRDTHLPARFPLKRVTHISHGVAENGPEEILCSGEYLLARIEEAN